MNLLMSTETTTITIEALAAASGVGKQTIYRWWPSKAALFAEALSERARDRIPAVDTGNVLGDVPGFLLARPGWRVAEAAWLTGFATPYTLQTVDGA